MNDLAHQLEGLLRPWQPLPWLAPLQQCCRQRLQRWQRDRKCQQYLELLASLPPAPAGLACDFTAAAVRIGRAGQLDSAAMEALQLALFGLRPWRKGPFELFGIAIESEWASNLKWDRLSAAIAPLQGRRVLDVGSSNGYYLLRMQAASPALALGLEPYATFFHQFCLLQHFACLPRCLSLPLKFEELPEMTGFFDTLFHMGVLYHLRAPLDSLRALRRCLRRGGELVLETLVIPGEQPVALTPVERYAKMNNVYFLPTVTALQIWLERSGFERVRCIDVSRTTNAEQRRTAWIQTESLEDFLDPADPDRTVEGYPAPRRALLLAEAR